jgi:hypothetical protein
MPRTTERVMLDALWARLSQPTAGGPPRHVLAEHVRTTPDRDDLALTPLSLGAAP